jgi:hypothetical protein
VTGYDNKLHPHRGMSFAFILNNMNIIFERNWHMQEINREEAEWLVGNNDVLNRQLQQNNHELAIFLTLANRQVCVVKYQLNTGCKSYYIREVSEN